MRSSSIPSPLITSNAYVDYKFERGFLMDEPCLRKVFEIITKRLAEIGCVNAVKIKVFRNDSLCYESQELDDILKEDNWGVTQIERIIFIVEHPCVHLNLDFDKLSGVILHIEGDKRDFVFVFYSDLKDFIQHEVITPKRIRSRPALVPLVGSLPFISFLVITGTALKGENIELILKSEDLSAKLNYLIKQYQMSFDVPRNFLIMTGASILLMLVFTTINKIIYYLYPENVFIIGKEIKRYDEKLVARRNIFWGVLVALAISVLGGILVYMLTK